jgi:putative transposase
MRRRYNFILYGYVIMPEHVHLFLSEPKVANLSTAVQALKLSVAVQQQRKPFWMHRYHDFNVIMTSTSSPKRSVWKSCVTFIAIR